MKTTHAAFPGTFRFIFALALPVLAEEMLTLLVGYTDWWLTSRFLPGTAYKAAMGLMAYITWLLPSLFAAVAIGGTALVSRFIGAGQRAKAVMVTNQAVGIGFVFAAGVTIAAWFGAPSFVSLLQLEGNAADLATRYVRILTPVIPAIMIEQVAAACLRGAGDTVSGFLAKCMVNLVNVTISTGLVLGVGPFPKLGWEGLAIGTACGHGIGGIILLAMLVRGRSGLKLNRRVFRPHASLVRRLLRIGLPGGTDVLAILSCHLAYVSIINRLGTEAAAAHGLGVQIEALAYLPGSAFQVAAATFAGQALGSGDAQRAMRGMLTACGIGIAVMSFAGLVFYFLGPALTTFFTGDWHDPTGQLTARLLKVVAFSMPALAVTMVLTGGLRGAGDTTWPLIFTLIGFLGIRLPGACLAAWDSIPLPWLELAVPGFGAGIIGVWWAMVADVVIRSLLVMWRFFHGGWAAIRI